MGFKAGQFIFINYVFTFRRHNHLAMRFFFKTTMHFVGLPQSKAIFFHTPIFLVGFVMNYALSNLPTKFLIY